MENTNYGGFWWRFLAMFIDGIILLIPGCGMGFIVSILSMMVMGIPQQHGDMLMLRLFSQTVCWLMGILMHWLYSALFESSKAQATPGKMICRLKVSDLDGNRLSFARATGRFFSKYVSSMTCLVGYIMAAFTERHQALHDMIAGTLVLNASPTGFMGEIPPENPQ